jgi:hypothetical protein
MIEITAPAPLPRGQRRALKVLKLIGCGVAGYIGYEMFSLWITSFDGVIMDAREEKLLSLCTMLMFFFVYVSWKVRYANGISYVFGFSILALSTLAALTNYEWRWFAYAMTGILGMFVFFVSIGITFSILERRA